MLPTTVRTERLVLHRPRRRDAQAIFDTYASDPEVTRHLTWRTHTRMRTGYLVARPLWGKGYAGEMLRGMVWVAFERRLCAVVEALVDPQNVRSVHVLEREGFEPEGQTNGVHPNLGPELRTLDRYVRRAAV